MQEVVYLVTTRSDIDAYPYSEIARLVTCSKKLRQAACKAGVKGIRAKWLLQCSVETQNVRGVWEAMELGIPPTEALRAFYRMSGRVFTGDDVKACLARGADPQSVLTMACKDYRHRVDIPLLIEAGAIPCCMDAIYAVSGQMRLFPGYAENTVMGARAILRVAKWYAEEMLTTFWQWHGSNNPAVNLEILDVILNFVE